MKYSAAPMAMINRPINIAFHNERKKFLLQNWQATCSDSRGLPQRKQYGVDDVGTRYHH